MDKETRPIHMLHTKPHFRPKGIQRVKEKGWKKVFHANHRALAPSAPCSWTPCLPHWPTNPVFAAGSQRMAPPTAIPEDARLLGKNLQQNMSKLNSTNTNRTKGEVD